MDLKEKTEIELKALIFDEMCKLEQIQYNINVLKKELMDRGDKDAGSKE